MPRQRVTVVSLLLASLGLLTACGEGGSGGKATPTDAPSTSTTTSTSGGGNNSGTASGTPATADDGAPIVYATGTFEIRPGATGVYGDPADVDFGVTRPGTKLRTEFRLVNPTDQPVKVLAAQPTCQCTTVTVSNEVIPPRGALGIPATLQVPNTTGMKQAAINTALENGQGVRLTLTAVAAYAVRTDPLYVDALSPEGMTGRVVLESTDGRPFRVISVNGGPPLLETPDAPATRHVVGYDLTGETEATMPKWLLFETDHPEAAMIEMRVRNRWSMLPHQYPGYRVAIQFDGYIANLGAMKPGVPAVFDLQLKNFAGQTLRAIRSGDPRFEAALVEQTPGDDDRVRITATVTPAEDVTGPFIVPLIFEATSGSEQMYAIGTVR